MITKRLRRYAIAMAMGLSVNGSVAAQVDQAALVRQLGGSTADRARALESIRSMPLNSIEPALRTALINALEAEGGRHARLRRGEVRELENPELIAGFAHVVTLFRDPRAIDPLVGALGTSPPAIHALAGFGDRGAQAVLRLVKTGEDDPSIMMDALVSLRFMVESANAQRLTSSTLKGIREVAASQLTAKRSVTTLWRAIDLAIALGDADLRRSVEQLATDRAAVVALGVTDPKMIAETQKIASERLSGVPALPRRN